MNRLESSDCITEEEEKSISHCEAYEEITVGSSCSTVESFDESTRTETQLAVGKPASIKASISLNRYLTHNVDASVTKDGPYSSSSLFDYDFTFDGEESHSDPVDNKSNQTEIDYHDSFLLCVTPQRRVSALTLAAVDDSLRVELGQ